MIGTWTSSFAEAEAVVGAEAEAGELRCFATDAAA